MEFHGRRKVSHRILAFLTHSSLAVHKSILVFLSVISCSVGHLLAEAEVALPTPLVLEAPLWEKLVEQGDELSLTQAKSLVVGLQGQEKIDGLVALMKVGVKGLADELKGLTLDSDDQMRLAWHAKWTQDDSWAPMLLHWAENSKDAFVQEYAILSLAVCKNSEVTSRLDAISTKGDLDRFVLQALEKTLAMLNKDS